MSKAAVDEFLALAAGEADIAQLVKQAIEERGSEAPFELVELAARHELVFTATELVARLVELRDASVELTDDQLEAVAGGLMGARWTGLMEQRWGGLMGIRIGDHLDGRDFHDGKRPKLGTNSIQDLDARI